jgi:glycosyltransferase involved in cell wall biosynthesis
MRKVVICSNMLNEADSDLAGWVDNMRHLTNTGIIVVDGGSKDGTGEILKELGCIVVVSDIIQKEGYGPARNHLRELARLNFPEADWMCFFDADERVVEADYFTFWSLEEYLREDLVDVVAFPRIDWVDFEMTKSQNNININPDPQARMTRLNSDLFYYRKIHEQVGMFRGFYFKITNPKINHFHQPTSQDKRDRIGKLCSYLHSIDGEHGQTYPAHKKEAEYYQKYLEEGL